MQKGGFFKKHQKSVKMQEVYVFSLLTVSLNYTKSEELSTKSTTDMIQFPMSKELIFNTIVKNNLRK